MNLSDTEISSIRAQLLDMSVQLEETLHRWQENEQREGVIEDGGHDHGDEASHLSQLGLNLEASDRNAYVLRLTQEALLKLDTNEYGSCIECDSQVQAARLLANPIAKRCIDCQSIHEDSQI